MTPGRDPSVIPAADLRARAADGHSYEQVMAGLLPAARALAVAPISGFRVGAVAQGVSGTLYLGANLEFPGLPLAASVHAEQAAIANAWHHGEAGVTALAVSAAPCGHCRQFLNELATAATLRILVDGRAPATLADLLPSAFGPRDLGVSGGLMRRHTVPFAATERADARDSDALAAAAVEAAGASYAPYSKAYSGVAVELADGGIHTGRYAENAAFNPSLPPLQSVLAGLAMRSIPFAAIRRAVLAETHGPVSQRVATEALLAAVAPGATLAYVRAVPADAAAATSEDSGGLDSTDTPALS